MNDLVAYLVAALASASTLFMLSVGLTLIFGVTRIVNFAHGSFYMLGAYGAASLCALLGSWGFWPALLLVPSVAALLGVLVERGVFRPLYSAPELYPLLATFALVLVIQDLALWIWGAEEWLGPIVPGLAGSVSLAGRQVPVYDLFLIVLAPLLMLGLWLGLRLTPQGRALRAASEDRAMLEALGTDARGMMALAVALGSALAALGGVLQLPKGSANLGLDLGIIAEAFVVTVVGGMGSLFGAYLAALLIASVRTLTIAFGDVYVLGVALWQFELVAMFLVMALVLVLRPQGLCGQSEDGVQHRSHAATPLPVPPAWRLWGVALLLVLALACLPWWLGRYELTLATEALIMVLFAASLQWLTGLGGMVTFGHAAYFGLGAYGSALMVHHLNAPMGWALLCAPLLAATAAALFGALCVRRQGVYLAMLTLAFAQLSWSLVFQWQWLTNGDNGLIGIWPTRWLSDPAHYYWLVLTIVAAAMLGLRWLAWSAFGHAVRASRDSARRARASGIELRRIQWQCFVLSGTLAGLAGGLYAFFKGNVSPDLLAISLSVDALVMVLLGGMQSLFGPIIGAVLFTLGKAELVSMTEHWRLWLGVSILALTLGLPRGLAGVFAAKR